MADTPLQNGTQPFREQLKALRQERGLSLEALAYATRDADPTGKGISFGGVGHLERGVHQPKPETVELIAAALEVDPGIFAEYRLAKLRELFDERAVGLAEAVENARSLSEALSEGGIPAPPGELGRRLTTLSPSQTDHGQADRQRRARPAKRRPASA